MSADFTLERDAFGRLILTDAAGRAHTGVAAVRAFPIHAPEEGISLLDADGHECAWIARLANLPPAARALVTEALEQREFMPTIQRVLAVSSFATPSHWRVQTDRGETWLTLKGEAASCSTASSERAPNRLTRCPKSRSKFKGAKKASRAQFTRTSCSE